MASELTVQTLRGPTSGANADTVLIPSGQTLHAPGHVIQTVHIEGGSSDVSFSDSGSWRSGSLVGNITPKFATSKILVIGQQPLRHQGTDAILRGAIRLQREVSGTATTVWNEHHGTEQFQVRGTPSEISFVIPFSVLDSPATTSSIEYKIQGYILTGGGPMILWRGARGARFTLQEIAQ